jgi:branched-chain amino acid transport system substrate-binding protein
LGELYGEKYGKPLDPNGCNQWDAMQVLFAAAEKAGPDRAGIRDEIEKTKGFVGVNGVYTFSPKQHQGPPAESVVLTEVVNLQFKLLRP